MNGRRIVAGDMPPFARRALGVRFSLHELVERGQTMPAGSQDRALSLSKGESSSHPKSSGDTEKAAPLTLLQAQDANRSAQRTNDTAAVLFTSGATGPSKGVVYRHGQLSRQLELMRAETQQPMPGVRVMRDPHGHLFCLFLSGS